MTKERKKEWEKQARIEAAATASLESARAAEQKAADSPTKLAEVARGYAAIAKKFPDTAAGKQAKRDAERLVAAPAKKP
jgi:hypothetical protein